MGIDIGEEAPDYTLKGTDGQYHSLSERDGAAVVIFTCNHCPYAQAYEERIAAIAREYDILVHCINSNDAKAYPEDSFEEMVQRADEKEFPYAYLRDEDQHVAQDYGATHTPEAFLIDTEGIVRYRGRIDDNWRSPEEVDEHSLREALNATLQGHEPPHALRPAIGCSIKWQ